MPNEFQTFSQLPNSRASVKHVHLVESSPALRSVQQKKLLPWNDKNGLKVHWHDSIDDIPAAEGIYTMLVAHEFFDALPFHLIEVRTRSLITWKSVNFTSSLLRKPIRAGKKS